MENKLIEVENLEVGDEIMISCQSFFKYLKILTPPALSKTKMHWNTKQPMFSNFKCSTRQEEKIIRVYTDSQGNVHNRTEKRWIPTSEDHNLKISQNLNGRQIWLVKKEK